MSQLATRPFKLWYRLSPACAWQPAHPIGSNLAGARIALLLAVKTIYRVNGRDIEIVEHIGAPQDMVAGS
jgi:hypothetical protein